MTPRCAGISKCGSDGITIISQGEKFYVEAGALAGNMWIVPKHPGGVEAEVALLVDGASEEGVLLRDPELGQTYLVSKSEMSAAGCSEITS